MRRVQRFAGRPASVPAARRFAGMVLDGQPADTVETVQVLVSELATNALMHGLSDFEVELAVEAGRVRVEVTDSGGGRPVVRRPKIEEAHGRGLQIVSVLADAWGVEPAAGGSGKTVWCELAVDRSGREVGSAP